MAKSETFIPIERVRTNPDNPRKKTDTKFKQLIKSVLQFPNALYVRGVVVDKKLPPKDEGVMTSIGGNQRWEAILKIMYMPEAEMLATMGKKYEAEADFWRGLREKKQVPDRWIIDASHFKAGELERFILIDNMATGEDDWELLAQQYTEEQLEEFGKEKLVEFGEDSKRKSPKAVDDGYVVAFNVHTDIVPGDYIEIGQHRLYCGNCTDEKAVKALLGDVSPELILTDPPYCSGGFQEAQKSSGSIGSDAEHKWGGKRPEIANDKLSTRGWAALLKSAFMNSGAHAIYCFIDWRMWVHLFDLAETCGFGVKNMIVWNKMAPGMGMGWRTQHELVLFGTRTTIKFDNHKALGNVIDAKRSGNPDHPTQKPVDLIGKILEVSDWAPNIYDPFVGSGTTMVAAHQMARRCFAMEIDPKYCHTVIDRMLRLDPDLVVTKNGVPYKLPELAGAD